MRRIFFTAIATAVLLGAAWIAWRNHESILARRAFAQLEQGSENEAAARLEQMAHLGAAGAPYLVRAMDDPRDAVALRARRTLWDALADWEKLPPTEAVPRLAALVDALDSQVASFSPSAQWEAGQLAVRILQWPLGGARPDGRRMVAACERILKQTETQAPPPTRRAETAQADAAQSAAESRAYAALLAAPELPGGGTLKPLPAVEQDAADVAGRGLEPPPLRVTGPVETARRPAANPSNDGSSGATQGQSNQGGQVAPLSHVTVRRRAAVPDAPDWEETVRQMRRLRSDDPKAVEEARFTLSMRGFTDKHFDLARRVFDPQVEVRVQTARMLPTLSGIEATPWLLLLARDTHPEVRSTALGLLATSPDATLAARARQIAADDPDETVQRQTNPAKRR